jgi:hypothetical protein
MVNLNINIRCPTARQDESDFVIPILIDFLAPSEFSEDSQIFPGSSPFSDSDSTASFDLSSADKDLSGEIDPESVDAADSFMEFLVGRMWAERVDWFYAEECGYDILDVCDARSGTWLQVLETLCHNGGKGFRKELNIDSFVNDVIFVHEALLHPEIADRVALLDAALRGITTDNSLILMYHEQSEPHHLEDWECHELGFKKIARSNLLLRDNHFRYPFSDRHTAGRPIEFHGTAEHEQWMLEHWEELIADHPSF